MKNPLGWPTFTSCCVGWFQLLTLHISGKMTANNCYNQLSIIITYFYFHIICGLSPSSGASWTTVGLGWRLRRSIRIYWRSSWSSVSVRFCRGLWRILFWRCGRLALIWALVSAKKTKRIKKIGMGDKWWWLLVKALIMGSSSRCCCSCAEMQLGINPKWLGYLSCLNCCC